MIAISSGSSFPRHYYFHYLLVSARHILSSFGIWRPCGPLVHRFIGSVGASQPFEWNEKAFDAHDIGYSWILDVVVAGTCHAVFHHVRVANVLSSRYGHLQAASVLDLGCIRKLWWKIADTIPSPRQRSVSNNGSCGTRKVRKIRSS